MWSPTRTKSLNPSLHLPKRRRIGRSTDLAKEADYLVSSDGRAGAGSSVSRQADAPARPRWMIEAS
jgi:hypothetical protein